MAWRFKSIVLVIVFGSLSAVSFFPTGHPPAPVGASPLEADCVFNWKEVPSPKLGSRPLRFGALKAISKDDVWVVGDYSDEGLSRNLALHWDGASWSHIDAPLTGSFHGWTAIDAAGRDNVWALGNEVARWNGETWRTPSKQPKGIWSDIAVAGQDQIWVAGSDVYDNAPALRRWNGKRWRRFEAPSESPVELFAIHALAANDIWAVGNTIRDGFQIAFSAHWDGVQWKRVEMPPIPGMSRLKAVSAAASNDVWAVGYRDLSNPLVLHWNGTEWQTVAFPDPNIYAFHLTDVIATAANDAWIVGYSDGYSEDAFLYHWNGTEWKRVTSPTIEKVRWLGGTSSTDLWNISMRGELEHWDGTTWTEFDAPEIGDGAGLVGVDGIGKDDIWAVGNFYDGKQDRSLVQHWDGETWIVVPSPNRGTGPNRLARVKAVTADDVWAWGYAERDSLVLRWDGKAWTEPALPNLPSLMVGTVDGDAEDDVWIGGMANGLAYLGRWDGTQWITMTPPTIPANGRVVRVVVKNANEVYVLAQSYREPPDDPYPIHSLYDLFKWDGSTWMTLGSFDFKQGIHGWLLGMGGLTVVAPDDLWITGEGTDYVVGTSLYVWHWDGNDWTTFASLYHTGKYASIDGAEARAADSLWIVGGQERYVYGPHVPLVQEWDGTKWNALPTEPFEDYSDFNDLTIIEDEIWAVGSAHDSGLVYHAAGCAEIPAKARLQKPRKNALLSKNKPTLTWNDAEGTSYAEVSVTTADGGKTILNSSAKNGTYSFTTALKAGRAYRWQVRDCSFAGCGEWTERRKFTIR